MAFPLVTIPAAVVTRFGPWFGRVAKASPAIVANVSNKLRTAGATVGSSVSEIIDYARANPANAALVFGALASFGMSVSELFDSKDKTDPDIQSAVDDLRLREGSVEESMRNAARFEILKIAAMSESFKPNLSNTELMLATSAEILRWAQGFFGGQQSAMRAHSVMQAFFEMSSEDVEAGFRRLKL